MKQLATIGYQDLGLDAFIALLKKHKIKQLVDVRELPLSRKRGFSKNLLRQALASEGISYEHLQELGTPKHIRYEYKKTGNVRELLASYTRHFRTAEPQLGLHHLEQLAAKKKTAIMCFEKDSQYCHRSVIAKAMQQRGWNILDV